MKLSISTLALALMTTGLTAPTVADAAPRSMFSYVERFAAHPTVQKRFINSMINNYTRSIGMFDSLVSRYSRFAGASWYNNIVVQRDWYIAERAKYTNALAPVAPVVLVTLVNTTTDTDYTTEVVTGAPYVKTSEETIVEETVENIVNVYAVLTKVLETEIVKTTLATTTTTKYFSNNTTESSSKTVTSNIDREYTQETVTTRELINTYAVAVEVEVEETDVADVDGEMGVRTTNVLTVDEYLARDDVSLAGTETYKQAVWNMNSRINENYIERDTGLAIYGKTLEAVGAPEAWARGWTGKGSTIAILDTGIDLDHSEFDGRITGTACFIGQCNIDPTHTAYESVQDENRFSHGTHVAGIAAAALDGVGTTGVAPDANLLIGKVAANNGYYDMNAMAKGIAWASNNGAVVANVSGNYNVSTSYKNALTATGDGTFQLLDNNAAANQMLKYQYGKLGYSGALDTTQAYSTLSMLTEAMADSEIVMVAAAGNQRLDFSTFPAHYAVYTDEQGELLFDGRIIVAGNYDIRSQTLSRSSNKAGTVCYDTELGTNTCDSGYRIKDFYLMAPGQYVASTDSNGEYRTNSGTSMAAPVISGAVAVVHQMWPHMKGSNIAKLLLETGNKDIPNYDANIHGQGLLDLAEATTPQGFVGIPTGGRADGARTTVAGTIAMNGGGAISSLNEVMVIDDYSRDFYIDANSMVAVNDTRTASSIKFAQQDMIPDYYMGFTNGQAIPMGENLTVSLNADASNTAIAYNKDGVTLGLQTETGSFLGNVADSSIMRVQGATTAYMGYEFDNGAVFGSAQVGLTTLDVDSTSMMKDASTLTSYSATLGTKRTIGNTTWGATVALPVAINSGSAEFATPTSVSTDGTLNYATTSSSMATGNVEVDYGLFMNTAIAENTSIESFVELRTNYAGTAENTTAAGINFKVTF